MTSWRPETGWSGWNPLAGAMTGFGGVVDAVSLRSGRVDVAMTGLDGRVQVLTDDAANGAALRHWQSLNGPVAASGIGLSIVATGGGGVAVLLTDTGGQNWIVDRRGSNDWGSWQPVGQ